MKQWAILAFSLILEQQIGYFGLFSSDELGILLPILKLKLSCHILEDKAIHFPLCVVVGTQAINLSFGYGNIAIQFEFVFIWTIFDAKILTKRLLLEFNLYLQWL